MNDARPAAAMICVIVGNQMKKSSSVSDRYH
jgi:hypothetical protein